MGTLPLLRIQDLYFEIEKIIPTYYNSQINNFNYSKLLNNRKILYKMRQIISNINPTVDDKLGSKLEGILRCCRNLPCLNLIEILNNESDKKSITWKNDELLGKFKSKNSLNTLTTTNNCNHKIKIKKIKDIICFATRTTIKCISKKIYFLEKKNISCLL